MRRSVVVVLVVLAFGGIALWKGEREAVPTGEGRNGLSAERKAEIRRFWEVYRNATEAFSELHGVELADGRIVDQMLFGIAVGRVPA